MEPVERLIIGLKSTVHFWTHHGPIARRIFEVDTPGIRNTDVPRHG
ncbi:MAG: hypothetical protein AB7W28_02795 [Armatimonadota bacterium]